MLGTGNRIKMGSLYTYKNMRRRRCATDASTPSIRIQLRLKLDLYSLALAIRTTTFPVAHHADCNHALRSHHI